MALDCNNPSCTPVLPASMLITITGERSVAQNTDCSTNLLYLTDDAGLINQTDPLSGDYLTTDNRYRQISNAADLELHFSKCNRTYFELSRFFLWPVGARLRPQTVMVAYFDSATESMTEALEDVMRCFKCFYTVTHVAYDRTDTAIYDTAPQLELAEWATVNFANAVLPTIDSVLTDATENSSNAYLSKQSSHTRAIYQLLNEECVPELDVDCEPTAAILNVNGVQHLLMASVIASVSMESTNALFNVHGSPQGGVQLTGVSTAYLNESETWAVMGDNLQLGGIQPNHPHHVNVYHNVANYRILMSGLSATAARIDELVYQRYMRDTLNNELMSLIVNNQALPMRNDSLIRSKMTSVIRSFVSKGLIPDTPNALDKTPFQNIYLQGNGWVLERENLTDRNIRSRIYPSFKFCYANQDLTNYFSISICEGA